jgi:hypothetical protein
MSESIGEQQGKNGGCGDFKEEYHRLTIIPRQHDPFNPPPISHFESPR